jgi:hypothetical protein
MSSRCRGRPAHPGEGSPDSPHRPFRDLLIRAFGIARYASTNATRLAADIVEPESRRIKAVAVPHDGARAKFACLGPRRHAGLYQLSVVDAPKDLIVT